jgi:hypothetical protein
MCRAFASVHPGIASWDVRRLESREYKKWLRWGSKGVKAGTSCVEARWGVTTEGNSETRGE